MSGTRSLEWPGRGVAALPANLHHTVAAAGLGWLMAAAAVMLWRQAAGALRHPLEPAALLAAAVAATAAAVAVRGSWLATGRNSGQARRPLMVGSDRHDCRLVGGRGVDRRPVSARHAGRLPGGGRHRGGGGRGLGLGGAPSPLGVAARS